MKVFFRLFGAAILVFAVHLCAEHFGVYGIWTWSDGPMHFAGGVAMAIMALELERLVLKRAQASSSIPTLYRFVAIVGFVAIIGIAWEWFEYGLDHYVTFVRDMIGISQPSIGDTMADLFFDLAGGTCTFILSLVFFRHKN